METYAIILGGGVGKRMDNLIPKQFIPIVGKPIIMHTIQKFRDFDPKLEIILVLPDAHITLWKDLCNEFKFGVEHQIVRGGKERFYSVKNALERLPGEGIVLIHDGVRPLVSHKTIGRVIKKATKKGNAIPYIDINESIRKITKKVTKPVKRESYKLIQTPQAFKVELIKKAYQTKFQKSFTDDSRVLETMGEQIELVRGNLENIKITRPIDLTIAGALLGGH